MSNELDEFISNNPNVSRETIKKLAEFQSFLLEQNIKHNLVSKNQIDKIWMRHIHDSLRLLNLLDLNKLKNLLDKSPVGTYKAIIAVDFAGRAIDLKALKIIADKYKLSIIEDSCHSPGGFFIDDNGVKHNCGNGKFADMSIFSFHPVKHIACGEGGMITTNNTELYEKLLLLRSHGITKDKSMFKNSFKIANGIETEDSTYPGWYMEMQTLGYNYRLSDIQASLGISQLKRAKIGLEKRRKIASVYNSFFENKNYIKGHSQLIDGHAYHLYIIMEG